MIKEVAPNDVSRSDYVTIDAGALTRAFGTRRTSENR